MATYKVNWRYYSSQGGPWMEGDVVQVDEPLAEVINRDSPGVLTPVDEGLKPLAGKGKGKDRQVKKAETRRLDRQGDPGDQGPITKADFKAVKK